MLFLDADDEFFDSALSNLAAAKNGVESSLDVIAFDYVQKSEATGETQENVCRSDLEILEKAKPGPTVLSEYLLNRVEPSVIFYAFSRNFLVKNKIEFRGGYHEDVDYMFRVFTNKPSLCILRDSLYIKWDTPGSIVNRLSTHHINGYFDALVAINNRLSDLDLKVELAHDFYQSVVNVTSSRLARVLKDEIVKEEAIEVILDTLYRRVEDLAIEPIVDGPGRLKTKYEAVFEEFCNGYASGWTSNFLLQKIQDLMQKSWSCYDLHNSIFLRPDEVRTCCKRYFYRGERKGDVVLMRGAGDQTAFTHEEIRKAKQHLHFEINRNNAPGCKGCPFLSFENWGEPIANGVKYLSLEYHTICNMRCTYCDDTYYGGKKPRYNVEGVVDSLGKAGVMSETEYIVWGGGEPVIEKRFAPIAMKLAESAPKVRQRVITNCTVYSEPLEGLLRKDQAFIVTSLDAGTEPVFRKIRQYDRFSKVLNNLERYASVASENVVIKYILLPENKAEDELHAFARLVQDHALTQCNFQISCDFKSEQLAIEEILSLVRLHSLLQDIGVKYQFVDDLVWQRLPCLRKEGFKEIRRLLSDAGLAKYMAEPNSKTKIAIWGTGAQAGLMMDKSWFINNSQIECFIDPRQEKVGTTFRGKPVYGPEKFVSGDQDILIAAVQSSPFIFRQGIDLGILPGRFIKSFII